MSYRYFMHLAYDGTHFHGWQLQKGVRSIQGEINEALSLVLQNDINLVGCGRTDTGVHASDFYAHFNHEIKLEEAELEHLTFKLNKMLGKEIAIYSIFRVVEDAHARFSALTRTYQYRIARRKNPFEAAYSYYLYGKIDVSSMNEACEILMQYHDFECFSKVNTQVNTFECKIYEAFWEERGDMLIFQIKADRFLRNMVRAIVGTMLDIGIAKYKPAQMHHIIQSRDRSEAGFSVPARGLFLSRVTYPHEIHKF